MTLKNYSGGTGKINEDMNRITIIDDRQLGLELIPLNNPTTRYASRGIVLRDDGKIAVFNKAEKNEFKLPGGGRNDNETPEDTFIREVLEETGCNVEITDCLGIIEEHKTHGNWKQISHVFVSNVLKDTKSLNLTNMEKDEGGRILWMDTEEALISIIGCLDRLKASSYSSLYASKFIPLRDSAILKYYIDYLSSK